MNACVIACRTLEKELLAAMNHTGCAYPVRWLPAGAHNVPQKRRAQIREALNECACFDTVLLAMTDCGGCTDGLQSPGPRILVPRCDDCITLLLGSPEIRKQYPATYFLTGGWLAGADNIWTEYRRAVEKHGRDRADRIFGAMLKNYRQLAFVDTGCADHSGPIQEIASVFGLEYIRIPGTLTWLEDLLTGNWDDRFRILPAACHTLTLLPRNAQVRVPHGANLLEVLCRENVLPDTPCGGRGSCGKCRVLVDGREALACQTRVASDMTVTVHQKNQLQILQEGLRADIVPDPAKEGLLLAFDIGTTSVVCCLTDGGSGSVLATAGVPNPQSAYGADLISRIRAALEGHMDTLTQLIRDSMTRLTEKVCTEAGVSPAAIGTVCFVGNPAMQQLFLGISPENLVSVPYSPVLTRTQIRPCREFLPCCPGAELVVVPDIGGFVGADTVGCILAAKLQEAQELTLLVDIGTNGEMVLGCRDRLLACSAAAGPALEGAGIRFGMPGAEGAIDHVWLEGGQLRYSVIGGGKAAGICGSGLVDTVAVMLELGLLNSRGRILREDRIFPLTEDIFLTQEDIRQVQLAKGAILAGIRLLIRQFGITVEEIQKVCLAGAFGTHLDPESACRIGLLPAELAGRITPIGNAALTGARMMACSSDCLRQSQIIADRTEHLSLADLPEFPKTFAHSMSFSV